MVGVRVRVRVWVRIRTRIRQAGSRQVRGKFKTKSRLIKKQGNQ
jgi:hypothetical protein